MTTAVDQPQVTVADLVAAVRSQRAATGLPRPEPAGPLQAEPAIGTEDRAVITMRASTVVVLGVHGGAGASTVTLALSDALAEAQADAQADAQVGASRATGVSMRVIDLASPASSGVAPAAECEIASEYPGWRAARRGRATIYSPTVHPSQLTLADIPEALAFGVGHAVIDLGRPWQPGATDRLSTRNRTTGATTRTVLVCRATVPGLRHAEHALAGLSAKLSTDPSGDVILAPVGARRWASEVVASLGPHTAAAVEDHRCVLVPPDRRLARHGPEAAPFSKPIAAAARRLAALLWASPPSEGTR